MPHRRAGAYPKRRVLRRHAPARLLHRFTTNPSETGRVQIACYRVRIAMPEWGASQKGGWVVGKCVEGTAKHDARNVVVLEIIPHVEKESPSEVEHSADFAKCREPIGEEHDPKLADRPIEGSVVKWQRHRVGDR